MNAIELQFLSCLPALGTIRATEPLKQWDDKTSAPIHPGRTAVKHRNPTAPIQMSNTDKVRGFIKMRKRTAWSLGDCALATGLTKSQVTNTLSGVYGLVWNGEVNSLGNGRYIKA